MHLLYELSYPCSVHCVGKGKPIEGNSIFLVDSIYIENFERVGGIYMEGWIIYSCSELMVLFHLQPLNTGFVAICYNFAFIQIF